MRFLGVKYRWTGTRVRLAADNDRLKSEVALLREELRIKDARMVHIPPRERPHYPPTERMAILQLKAARNWSAAHTAERFLLTATTIRRTRALVLPSSLNAQPC